jgi:hypothetical protein
MRAFKILIVIIIVLTGRQSLAQSKDSLFTKPLVNDLSLTRVTFDSLKVSINPPLHFTKIDSVLYGFIHLGANASLIIAETEPIVYAVAPYYTVENFARQNETLISKDTLYMHSGYWAYQFVLQFKVDDVLVERIFLIAGIDGKTIVVTANYPAKIHNLLYPVFIESLKTIIIEK